MPSRLPLIGGAYAARSVIASAVRAVNYYPEKNPSGAPVAMTHYQRPGLRLLKDGGFNQPGRLIWAASDGSGYCVIGQNVYYIAPDWSLTQIGIVTAGLTTPVSMVDNGSLVMVVDGSVNGWLFDLPSHGGGYTPIHDASFNGADRVDYIDTFILWNVPGTNQFRSTLSNQIIPMDPLYVAAKTGWPDPLVTGPVVTNHEIMLPGLYKSERWYDAGDAQFPFAQLPGSYTEHGGVAKYSFATSDISVYWLGQDKQGQGIVFRQKGYQCERISNHAIEYALEQMYLAGTISDAIGYTFQQGGHVFYALQFPTGNQTWVFDEAVGEPEQAWHQRAWTDGNGVLNRERNNGYAFLYGKSVTIDWETGAIYQMDPRYYYDQVKGVEGPITCIRTFPHLMSGSDPLGNPILANGRMVQHNSFQLDVECGNNPIQDQKGMIALRWSDTRGKSWQKDVLQSAGAQGQFGTRPNWNGVGQAMDRVYEVSHSIPAQVSLNGAWVDGQVLNQ